MPGVERTAKGRMLISMVKHNVLIVNCQGILNGEWH